MGNFQGRWDMASTIIRRCEMCLHSWLLLNPWLESLGFSPHPHRPDLRFPTMPFTLRALETERSRFGIVECLNHSLLHPYPVLHEKANELVRRAA